MGRVLGRDAWPAITQYTTIRYAQCERHGITTVCSLASNLIDLDGILDDGYFPWITVDEHRMFACYGARWLMHRDRQLNEAENEREDDSVPDTSEDSAGIFPSESDDSSWHPGDDDAPADEGDDVNDDNSTLASLQDDGTTLPDGAMALDDSVFTLADDSPSPYLWLGDSGASCHMTAFDSGLFDWEPIRSPIRIGNGKTLTATKIGKIKLTVMQVDGTTLDVVLSDCKYVPGLCVNLFSLTKAMQNGWSISNKGVTIFLRNGSFKLAFDRILPLDSGVLVAVEMKPRGGTALMALEAASGKPSLDLNVAHQVFGHANANTVTRTCNAYGIKLGGQLDPCVHCALAKAKQKNVVKFSLTHSEVPGERLFIDVSSAKHPSISGTKYWLLVVDDATDFSWSSFLKSKDEVVNYLIPFLKNLKAQWNMQVKFIRCNNGGENIKLEQTCREEGLGIKFEFTSPGSPQYNGRVERKFATLYSKV